MIAAGHTALPVREAGTVMMAGGAADVGDGGKAERFKTLALPHLDDIYTLARYLLRSTNDADDAVQECYLRAFRHFDTFRGPAIKPWLMTILRNVCHAAHAGNARLDYRADADEAGVTPIWREDSDTPEQTMVRQHESEAMRALIEKLPAEF